MSGQQASFNCPKCQQTRLFMGNNANYYQCSVCGFTNSAHLLANPKYCPQCRAYVIGNGDVCQNCGYTIVQTPAGSDPTNAYLGLTKKQIYLIVGGGAFLVLLIAATVALQNLKREKSNSNQNAALLSSPQAKNSQCPLTLQQAPEIRGFRLGMTMDELKKRFPNFKTTKSDEFGFIKGKILNSEAKEYLGNVDATYVSPAKYPEFKEMFLAELHLFKDRVISLQTGYPSGAVDMSKDEYKKKVAETLGLPNAYVDDDSFFSPDGIINCEGFRATVGTSSWKHPDSIIPTTYFSILIEDTAAIKQLDEQRKQYHTEKLRKGKEELQKQARENGTVQKQDTGFRP